MKRFVIVLFSLIVSILLLPQAPAAADTSLPHVVVSGETWLSSSTGEKLFLLPETYYAEILSLDDNYYYITFNGVNGRVSKTALSTVGYHKKAAGTMCDMRIDEAYSEFPAINLKARPDLAADTVTAVPISASFTFVGRYPLEDELWYAVRYDQHFGYLRAARTDVKDIAIAAFVPEQLPTAATPEDTEDSTVFQSLKDNGSTLKTVLIIGLIVPAILVIFLIFRPKAALKRPRQPGPPSP